MILKQFFPVFVKLVPLKDGTFLLKPAAIGKWV